MGCPPLSPKMLTMVIITFESMAKLELEGKNNKGKKGKGKTKDYD